MTTQTNNDLNGPIETLRDGSLKATIWSNIGEKGTFYTVDFSRTYSVGDEIKNGRSFSGSDPLRIARLATKAYDRMIELRRADKAAA